MSEFIRLNDDYDDRQSDEEITSKRKLFPNDERVERENFVGHVSQGKPVRTKRYIVKKFLHREKKAWWLVGERAVASGRGSGGDVSMGVTAEDKDVDKSGFVIVIVGKQ
ncbi:hypothetical protein ACFE04_022382 [Oxalis oulophora]